LARAGDDRDDDGDRSTDAPGRAPRRGKRWAPVAALLALAGVIVGAVVLVSGDSGGEPSVGTDAQAAGSTTTTSAPEEITPQQAFALARVRLEDAGSFIYRGTASAAGPSIARPGPWLPGELTLEGEVSLPDVTHEVAVDGSGRVAETATSGVTVWGRSAGDRAGLAERTYEVVAEIGNVGARVGSGAALLPVWLGATTDRRDGGTDSDGRRTFRATVAAERLGADDEGRAMGPAEIVLTLDEAGNPARVEITTVSDDPPLRVAVDLAALGEPVTISVPGGDEPTSVTGPVTVDEVVSAGIARPVELARVPPNWVLRNMELTPNMPRTGCSALELDYQDADAVYLESWIDLNVTSADCPVNDEPFPEPLTAGRFTGTIEASRDGSVAQVTDGETAIDIFTDLPTEDLVTLLESLVPFDPSTPPEPTADVSPV
jgi:hypothetical protein